MDTKNTYLAHTLRAFLCLLLVNVACFAQTATDSDTTTKLVEIKPDASLLQAPQTGDFEVAKTAPKIRWAILPAQREGAELWSSWGDAVLASDGNYYLSIGDHDHPYGESKVYRVNPQSGVVDLVVNVNDYLDAKKGQYAPGKIHAPLVDTKDGYLYFGTYRGSAGSTGSDIGYKGDALFRYNLETGETENLGIVVPHSSWVVTEFHEPSRRLYGLAVPGRSMDPMVKKFFVYDIDEKKLVFSGGPESPTSRAMILGNDGRAWYDTAEGTLAVYDPKTNKVTDSGLKIPSDGKLRAASRETKDGIVYAITHGGTVFALDTKKNSIREIAKTFDFGPSYTTAVRLDPTERYLYYVPGAHGGTSKAQTPVVQLDVKTGQRKALAFLNPALRKQHAYNLGGTFGIALSEDGSQLLINFNGAPDGQKKSPDFGLCSVMVLDIPESERTAAK